jgi:AsmA protein
MKLNWKTIAIAAGGVIGVLVLAVVLFFVFFPKDLAAREAERRIEEATNRDLVLGENIDITFWPALGFSVDQASLSNPEGFESEHPFIAADRIVFAVAVWPLLSGDIQVKQLIFEGAQIRMIAQGAGPEAPNNWTFPTEENSEQEFTLEDLRLDDVRMSDSLISFDGGAGEPPLVIEDVDASLALQSLDQPAQLDAAFNYRGERMNVDGEVGLPRALLEKGETPLRAQVRADPLEANFDGIFNAATGAMAGSLDANGGSLRSLLAWMGSPMADGGGFGPFRLTAQMTREGETTSLTDLAMRLDAINAQGALTLINQENGRLRVNGALNAGNVDLNPYLPAPAQGGGEGGVEVSNAWDTAPIDLTGLRALDANLDLTLGSLAFQRMNFTNVALNLRVANGAADARLSRISLYDGGGTARLIADGSGATPRIAVELNAQNIQAETLLRDAIGFDKIVGRGRLTASLVGAGSSQAAIMRSLRGNAAFNFSDGEWKGVNLALVGRQIQSALTGQAVGPQSSTDFSEISSTFTIAEGRMATDDLRMLTPYARLEGRGIVNIGAQSIDMRITPRAVGVGEGQGGDAGERGYGVPFQISGPWSRVGYRVALEDVVQNELRNILSREDEGSPLAALGEALFGRQPPQPATPAETPAQQGETQTPQQPPQGEQAAPPPAQPERPRNPLEEILRRAAEDRQKQKQQEQPPTQTP